MTVRLHVLSSGSKANATVLLSPQGGLLIDNGLSLRALKERMAQCEIPADAISAVLLTHEHVDHAKGIRLACDFFKARLYTTEITYNECLRRKSPLPDRENICTFTAGDRFSLAGFDIRTFSVPHDAMDPIGLNIRYENQSLGFATDLGCVSGPALRHLSDCDALVLEANYDSDMLWNCSRPIYLKQRIASRQGHLSNDDALAALDTLLTPRTQSLIFAHLSQECNVRESLMDRAAEKLSLLNLSPLRVLTARQDTALDPIPLVTA